MTPFWFDANVFIEAKNRYYTFERVPKFWVFLDEQLIAGSIYSPKLVYDELVSYKDQLAGWIRCRKDKGLCVRPTDQIEARVQADSRLRRFDLQQASERGVSVCCRPVGYR